MNKEEAIEILKTCSYWIPEDAYDERNRLQKVINWIKEIKQ